MIVHIVAPCHQVVQPCWITSGLLADHILTESSTLLLATEEGTRISSWGAGIDMYRLDHAASHWLQTALGLLATVMVTQGYALYSSIKRMRQLNS